MTRFVELPHAVVYQIVLYLYYHDKKHVHAVSRVNKTFYQVCNNFGYPSEISRVKTHRSVNLNKFYISVKQFTYFMSKFEKEKQEEVTRKAKYDHGDFDVVLPNFRSVSDQCKFVQILLEALDKGKLQGVKNLTVKWVLSEEALNMLYNGFDDALRKGVWTGNLTHNGALKDIYRDFEENPCHPYHGDIMDNYLYHVRFKSESLNKALKIRSVAFIKSNKDSKLCEKLGPQMYLICEIKKSYIDTNCKNSIMSEKDGYDKQEKEINDCFFKINLQKMKGYVKISKHVSRFAIDLKTCQVNKDTDSIVTSFTVYQFDLFFKWCNETWTQAEARRKQNIINCAKLATYLEPFNQTDNQTNNETKGYKQYGGFRFDVSDYDVNNYSDDEAIENWGLEKKNDHFPLWYQIQLHSNSLLNPTTSANRVKALAQEQLWRNNSGLGLVFDLEVAELKDFRIDYDMSEIDTEGYTFIHIIINAMWDESLYDCTQSFMKDVPFFTSEAEWPDDYNGTKHGGTADYFYEHDPLDNFSSHRKQFILDINNCKHFKFSSKSYYVQNCYLTCLYQYFSWGDKKKSLEIELPKSKVNKAKLMEAINQFKNQQEFKDYHPGSNGIVRDIVHPGIYSFVNGISKLTSEAQARYDANWIDFDKSGAFDRKYEKTDYQWLPTDFVLDSEGKCKIQGEINNLPRTSETEGLYEELQLLFESFCPKFQTVYDNFEFNNFTDTTVQVITKIVDYELKPGDEFNGVWHLEGMPHENIVLTGLCILHRDTNIRGGDILMKKSHDEDYEVPDGYDQYDLTQLKSIELLSSMNPVGRVLTPSGRLFAFPNYIIHRVNRMYNPEDKLGQYLTLTLTLILTLTLTLTGTLTLTLILTLTLTLNLTRTRTLNFNPLTLTLNRYPLSLTYIYIYLTITLTLTLNLTLALTPTLTLTISLTLTLTLTLHQLKSS